MLAKSHDRPVFDVIGRTVVVGDWVSYTVHGNTSLKVGKVLRVTAKMVRVGNGRNDRSYFIYEDNMVLLPPEDVMMWLLSK